MKNILFFQNEEKIKIDNDNSLINEVIETTTVATIDDVLQKKLTDSEEIQLYTTTEQPSYDFEDTSVELDMDYPNITSMVQFNALMQNRVNILRSHCSKASNNVLALHANYLYVLKVGL